MSGFRTRSVRNMAEVRLLFGRGAGSLWPPTAPLPLLTPNKISLDVRCYRSASQETPLHPSKGAYYSILGVPPNATLAQIKAAYYRQSLIHHPDRNPGNQAAAALFARISEAYGVLGNGDLRRKYDLGVLTRGVQGGASGDPESGRGQHPAGARGASDFDAFYRAHYGGQLQRQRDIRARLEERRRREGGEGGRPSHPTLGRASEIAAGIMLAVAAAIVFSLR